MIRISWVILAVALLLLFGDWSLRIRLVIVYQDIPFLFLGLLGGWYLRGRSFRR